MAKESLELQHTINSLRVEYDQLVAKGDNLTAQDVARINDMDRQLTTLIPAYKAAQVKEDRMDSERNKLNAIFRGDTPPTPTGDGSRGYDAKAAGGFAGAILGAGFDLRSNPAVTVNMAQAYGVEMKASVDLSSTTPATYRPLRVEGVYAMGRDERFLFPFLPTQGVGDESSVDEFVQTGSRTITGSVERALAAVTAKATLDVAIDHVSVQLKTLAVLMDEVPNQVLRSIDGIAAFLSTEAKFALDQALDAHCLAQILAASPPNGVTGANTIEHIRYGIAAMRLLGSNPDILVMNPTESAALDLLQDGEDRYYWSTAQTNAAALFGVRVVEHTTTAGTQAPVLIDSSRIGQLYLGTLRFEADPFSLFSTNRTNLRMEGNALMHVRDANAAYVIEA